MISHNIIPWRIPRRILIMYHQILKALSGAFIKTSVNNLRIYHESSNDLIAYLKIIRNHFVFLAVMTNFEKSDSNIATIPDVVKCHRDFLMQPIRSLVTFVELHLGKNCENFNLFKWNFKFIRCLYRADVTNDRYFLPGVYFSTSNTVLSSLDYTCACLYLFACV